MRTIIAGGRDYYLSKVDIEALEKLHQSIPITEVVSGKATGVDQCGEDWAKAKGIPVKPFPVTPEDWRRIGKAAGPLRNAVMAKYCQAAGSGKSQLIAFWDGKSSGTNNMISQAKKLGLKVTVIPVRQGAGIPSASEEQSE
jgi:hypothetical protein